MIRIAFLSAFVFTTSLAAGCAEKPTVATDADSLKRAAEESDRIGQEEGGGAPVKGNKKAK